MRRFVATLALLALFTGMATAQTVNPTAWDTNQQVGLSDANGDTAAVNQLLTVDVPKATALHLTVGELTFDINKVGDYANQDWYCTYGPASDTLGFTPLANGDYSDNGAVFGASQPQIMPMGTYYEQTTAWDQITVKGGGEVTSYPPVIQNSNGSVDNASKRNFVCYRTFVLQTFSNWNGFTLDVKRDDPTSTAAYPEPVYIQGNMECYIHAGTGLFALEPGSTDAMSLIPSPYNGAPTGAQCTNADSSWQDALIVVGVKIDGEHWGPSTTTLTYTLSSLD